MLLKLLINCVKYIFYHIINLFNNNDAYSLFNIVIESITNLQDKDSQIAYMQNNPKTIEALFDVMKSINQNRYKLLTEFMHLPMDKFLIIIIFNTVIFMIGIIPIFVILKEYIREPNKSNIILIIGSLIYYIIPFIFQFAFTMPSYPMYLKKHLYKLYISKINY